MWEKFTFSSLPSFPPDGWENCQPEGKPTVCQTGKKKKRKEKQKKENKHPETFVEFPAISILLYDVALAE